MRVFHTIPVPRGWSIEQSWEAISNDVLLTDPRPYWASIETTEDGKFIKVIDDVGVYER